MNNKQKSREYWEKRARENENKVYKQGSDLMKELNSSYTRARREIQKSINDLVARYMDKTELSYAEAVKNLTSSEFKEWRMSLEEYEAEIQRVSKFSPTLAKVLRVELETLAMKSRLTRLDILKAQIDFELNKMGVAENEILETGIGTVYKEFYKMYTTNFGLTGINTVLPKETVKRLMQQPWSGANFSERIWGNTEALGKVLKQEIIQSFMQGISVKDLSDRIEKRFITDRKNTERLVRTELNHALNETTKLSYEEAEIEEYEYLAEIDNRTSDICKDLNGQIFNLKDAKVGVNYPPMHPHCRSTTIPVIDYKNLGKKKDETKKIEKKEPKKIIEKSKKENDTIKEKEFVFKKANTIEEAEKFARDVLKLRLIDYDKFHLDVANMINKELTEFYNVFGNLNEKKALENIEIYSKLNKDAVAAYYLPLKTILMKNVKSKTALSKMQKTAEECFEAGFWTTNKKEHAIRHETGHAIQHMILDNNSKKTAKIANLRKTIAEKYGIYNEIDWKKGQWDDEKMKKIGNEISYYALYTDGEFVAESVAEYMAGNPRKIAKEVVDILLEGD